MTAASLIPAAGEFAFFTSYSFRPFEYLRLATLGVMGALVKIFLIQVVVSGFKHVTKTCDVPDTRVIIFLLSSEIMPLCLRAMETGSALSRAVATFIVQKLLLDDVGLQYICYLPERVFAVNHALENVLTSLAEQPSTRLLKHVIRCYLRFLDDGRKIKQLECGCNSCWTIFQDVQLPKKVGASDHMIIQCIRTLFPICLTNDYLASPFHFLYMN
ncbi:UNVERIFIED_CONTAM: CCR4-NOT transcription complex subunit [Sesamum latifolium]|uniref:CCR4-NOT transcription complex subunit n=1 Tax=Sesamum latifolium TaxID=2727402 RepID=A0AAW2WTV0_9LAMI